MVRQWFPDKCILIQTLHILLGLRQPDISDQQEKYAQRRDQQTWCSDDDQAHGLGHLIPLLLEPFDGFGGGTGGRICI